MTREKALNDFFNSFDIPAYPNTAIPDDAKMPYLTYDIQTSDFLGLPISSTVNVWYKTSSEAKPNEKVRDIEKKISLGGCMIACDNGAIWIKRGSPWCTHLTDANDNTIKRRYLNVTIEYLTT